MTKELQALELAKGLLKGTDAVEKGTGIKGCKVYATREIFEKIITELERLNAIDNAEPSEALGKLEGLYSNVTEENYWHWKGYVRCSEEIHKYDNDFKYIKQALLKAEKLGKAWEVVIKKEVNIQVFNQCEDVETYNKVYIKQKDRQLTKEEFELIKEMMK